jgi:hypothetical protein
MFAGDVYYCWSCDAHCRAVPSSNEGATCPRCREHLGEDSRLEPRPTILNYYTAAERDRQRKAVTTPGLWPTRAAAMH